MSADVMLDGDSVSVTLSCESMDSCGLSHPPPAARPHPLIPSKVHFDFFCCFSAVIIHFFTAFLSFTLSLFLDFAELILFTVAFTNLTQTEMERLPLRKSRISFTGVLDSLSLLHSSIVYFPKKPIASI
jgi:hypothetical protein